MPKHSSSRHGVTIPPDSTFSSLELTTVDSVFFAAGDDAASVGYNEADEGSDAMHPQEWLVTITEKAKRQAAKMEVAKISGDFTKRYVNIDSVDLGDDDEDADAGAEDDDEDDDAYERDDSDDAGKGGDDDMNNDEDDEEKRQKKKSTKIEWRPTSSDDIEKRRAMDAEARHDQYNLMELIAAREDDLKAATDAALEDSDEHQPKAKKARRSEDTPSISVATTFVETEPRRSLLSEPVRRSALLSSTVLTKEDEERLKKVELPSYEAPKKEFDDSSIEPLQFKMPRIGDEEGDEERREARHKRLEKVLRCDVAAFVNEKLTPYYKARRFADKVCNQGFLVLPIYSLFIFNVSWLNRNHINNLQSI